MVGRFFGPKSQGFQAVSHPLRYHARVSGFVVIATSHNADLGALAWISQRIYSSRSEAQEAARACGAKFDEFRVIEVQFIASPDELGGLELFAMGVGSELPALNELVA